MVVGIGNGSDGGFLVDGLQPNFNAVFFASNGVGGQISYFLKAQIAEKGDLQQCGIPQILDAWRDAQVINDRFQFGQRQLADLLLAIAPHRDISKIFKHFFYQIDGSTLECNAAVLGLN